MKRVPVTAALGRDHRPYNVKIERRRTSIRLQPREWEVLHLICAREGLTVHEFCTAAARQRHEHSVTARIRVALLDYFLVQLDSDAVTSEPKGIVLPRRDVASNPPLVDGRRKLVSRF